MKKSSPSTVKEIFPGLLVTGIILILVTVSLLQRGWQLGQDQIHNFEEYGYSIRDKLMAQYFERVGDGQTLSNLGLVRDSLHRPASLNQDSLGSFFKKFLGIYVVYSQIALLDREGRIIFSQEKEVDPYRRGDLFPGFSEVRAQIENFLERAKKDAIPFVSDSPIYAQPNQDRLERVFFTPVFEKNKLLGFVALQTNSIILEREISNLKANLKGKYFPDLNLQFSNPQGRQIRFALSTGNKSDLSLVEQGLSHFFSSSDLQEFSLPLEDARLNFLPNWNLQLKVNRFELLRWSYWLRVIAVLVTVLMGAAIWYVVWIFLRQKDRDQRVFTQGILDAQERERSRLAREIHDGVGQILLATKIQVTHLGKAGGGELDRLTEVNRSLDLAIKEIRTISHGLHPSVLEHLSLTEAVYQKVGEIEDVFKEVRLDVNLSPVEETMSQDFKSNLFRILQEALQNAIKHSKASMLSVELHNEKDRIRLRVEDNGVGFAKNSVAKSTLGLRSMEERVKIFGGDFRFGNNDRAGGFIECVFELKERSKQHVRN